MSQRGAESDNLEPARAEVERQFKRRGMEPPQLRSNNADPKARKAEEQKLWEDFWAKVADDLCEKFGLKPFSTRSVISKKRGGKK